MTIDNNLLRKKIKKVEEEFECALSIDRATMLIKKIQKKYPCSQKKRFKSLVEKIAKSLQLAEYGYCRVAFCYFGGRNKKNGGERKQEYSQQRQRFFSFYK